MTRLTNDQFAEMTGCDFTTASKLKTGTRMPSAVMLAAIYNAFHLDGNELLDAYSGGPTVFSAFLRSKVFQPPEDDPGHASPVSEA
jgi:transcriptional regulator with XRE-family HTH domain